MKSFETHISFDRLTFDFGVVCDCPSCRYRWGQIDLRELAPTRPKSCHCRKCGHQWEYAIEAQRYREIWCALRWLDIADKNLEKAKVFLTHHEGL